MPVECYAINIDEPQNKGETPSSSADVKNKGPKTQPLFSGMMDRYTYLSLMVDYQRMKGNSLGSIIEREISWGLRRREAQRFNALQWYYFIVCISSFIYLVSFMIFEHRKL